MKINLIIQNRSIQSDFIFSGNNNLRNYSKKYILNFVIYKEVIKTGGF